VINYYNLGHAGSVENGNLYYFSWGAFLSSLTLWFETMKEYNDILLNEVGDYVRNSTARNPRFSKWTLLLVTNIIVMSAGANLHRKFCENNAELHKDLYFCNTAVFAIFLGAVSACLALGIVILETTNNGQERNRYLTVETIVSLLIFNSYIAGVSIITNSGGAGEKIGNLYYFTWITFLNSFSLSMDFLDIFLLQVKPIRQSQHSETQASASDSLLE